MLNLKAHEPVASQQQLTFDGQNKAHPDWKVRTRLRLRAPILAEST